ncbi:MULTISPECIES: polysaccharide deacetylase family protein [unclassified Sphingopyxis]|uniref:polysaccharide deacetylase family protein n=1 Tax=unclassified Sphingopyxis TaxID=2614943 RepID=UPI0028618F2E|nr:MULTISPECIES: polysaccharide deacetylase family protein [unclassified Sphingopyxis]MDR7061405.1 peptidoglycan/xylan/chitin deacetylase (PgdA/CDA1 family) [Sphingopyxis sp. BE235]MDR7181864.1 peptidoglycan/xylan/chitin deacetylase (PgdA/CDA1 family) [Sphingopyxis sp. BE249]
MRLWLAIFFLLLAQPAHAQKQIALSFDDVPRHAGAFFASDERAQRIIAELKKAKAPQAVFFVVPGAIGQGDGVGGAERIAAYVAAGHVIANHSNSHKRLSTTDTAAYLADIDAAEVWLKGRPGYRPWFRFPFIDEGGKDKAKRDALRHGLAARGLRNGYVTAESSDWHLESLTREAVQAGKTIDRKALGDLYVSWHVEAADFADAMMRRVTGRQPVQMLLLHETDLAALHIGDLVRALRNAGWTVVSADTAYADPIGKEMPDTPAANGTLTEALAWAAGVPAPRWYRYNQTDLATAVFNDKVLGE